MFKAEDKYGKTMGNIFSSCAYHANTCIVVPLQTYTRILRPQSFRRLTRILVHTVSRIITSVSVGLYPLSTRSITTTTFKYY